MAHPLKARPKSSTAIETRLVFLTASDRHAHPTQQELVRVGDSAELTATLEDDGEAEFECKKQSIIKQSDPIVRVATFLLAIARHNEREGRDARIVYDSLKCGAVAELLDLDNDTVSRAIAMLQDNGLVSTDNADRLSLKDIVELERFADKKHQEIEILAPNSRWLISELRELGWLFLSLAGISIVSVAFSAIVAMAIFE
jgi:hypothetical protein